MNVGIIGLGRIGIVHIKALRSIHGVNIVSVSDINEDACKSVSEKFKIPNYYTDFKKLVTNKSIDVIWICSPSNLHYLHVSEALKNKKIVFCEKPLETDTVKIEKLIQEFEDIDRRLMIGFNRRFDPNFIYVKENIDKIGKPTILKITSRDPAPPPLSYIKTSGGIFKDMTIHDLDMALFISGSSVDEVYVSGAVNYVPEMKGIDIDTALITLKFENGLICNIDNSRKSVYGYDQRLEILGTKGMLKVNNKKIHQSEMYTDNSINQSVLENFFLKRYEQAYINEGESFFKCLSKNESFPVTAKNALESLHLAEACAESLETGKVIKLH